MEFLVHVSVESSAVMSAAELEEALDSLPLRSQMTLEVHPLGPSPAAAPVGSGEGSAAPLTPLVRRAAAERGVDPATMVGSGVGGRIRWSDVVRATPTVPPTPAPAPYDPGVLVLPALPPLPAPACAPQGREQSGLGARAEGRASSVRTCVLEVDVTAAAHGVTSLDQLLMAAAERAVRQRPRLLGPELSPPMLLDATPGAGGRARSTGERRRNLIVLRTATDGRLLADAPDLAPDEVIAMTLTSPRRRPVVVVSAGQEALAIRSVASLSLVYDTRHVEADGAMSLVLAVASHLEDPALPMEGSWTSD